MSGRRCDWTVPANNMVTVAIRTILVAAQYLRGNRMRVHGVCRIGRCESKRYRGQNGSADMSRVRRIVDELQLLQNE